MPRYIKFLFFGSVVIFITSCTTFKNYISPKKPQKAAPISRIDNTQNQYYTVEIDETLYEVGQKFNITERALILWNNIPNPYILKSGQVLRIFPVSVDVSEESVNQSAMAKSNFNNIQELDDESLNDYSLRNQQIEEKFISTNVSANQSTKLINKNNKLDSMVINNNVERLNNNGKYKVQSGDALLSIARSFNLSLSQIANLNNIDAPYQVNVGQILIIEANSEIKKESQPKIVIAEEIVTINNSKVENKVPGNLGAQWRWPIKLNTEIDSDATITLLSGSNGQDVHAACAGEIIYSGVGVQGYGKMIIIQCGNDYISAYSNLKNITINEGEKIVLGETIGHLGKFKGQSELGFEVRHLGDPVKLKSIMPK